MGSESIAYEAEGQMDYAYWLRVLVKSNKLVKYIETKQL